MFELAAAPRFAAKSLLKRIQSRRIFGFAGPHLSLGLSEAMKVCGKKRDMNIEEVWMGTYIPYLREAALIIFMHVPPTPEQELGRTKGEDNPTGN